MRWTASDDDTLGAFRWEAVERMAGGIFGTERRIYCTEKSKDVNGKCNGPSARGEHLENAGIMFFRRQIFVFHELIRGVKSCPL